MRIAKWDNAKFVLIFLVVFGHMASMFETDSPFLANSQYFIYLFHMPAFLFLSGLFSKKTVEEKRYDKILPYLVLYLFMKVFRFVVYRVFLGANSGFSLMEETGVPWFAIVLFICYLITVVVQDWKPAYALGVFVVLGIMIGYDESVGGFLAGMRLITFYPFFLAGYYMNIEKLQQFMERVWVKITATVILVATVFWSFSGTDRIKLSFLKGKATYEAMGYDSWGWLYRLGYYLVTMLLVICVLSLIPKKEFFVSKWGKRTIQVFSLHFPIAKVLVSNFAIEQWCSRIWPSHYALLVPLLALGLTIFLSLKIWEPFFKLLMNPTIHKKCGDFN